MSEFWPILWTILKYTALLGGGFVLITLLIIIFHPIRFTLNGRASIKGQRGEVVLSYLFSLLRIRYVATRKAQCTWLEFCGLRKLLDKEEFQPHKNMVKTNEEASDAGEADDTNEDENEQTSSEALEKNTETTRTDSALLESVPETTGDVTEKSVSEENPSDKTLEKESLSEETENKLEEKQEEQLSEDAKEQQNSDISEKSEDNGSSTEASVEEQSAETADETTVSESKGNENKDDFATATVPADEVKPKSESDGGWQKKLRKFKKDFNRRYEQLRGKIRLFKQKWNSLWPVVKRFWNRGKRGFRFYGASLMVRYSLDEHYLTGMLYGYLAPLIGFAQRYGLRFMPVAAFPEIPGPGIYAKATWNIEIRPYCLIWAVTALLFEKNLYKEAYWLYKEKKKKKRKNK